MILLLFSLNAPLTIAQLPTDVRGDSVTTVENLLFEGDASQLLENPPSQPNGMDDSEGDAPTNELDKRESFPSELDDVELSEESPPSLPSAEDLPAGAEVPVTANTLHIRSDRQTFNADTQVFRAEGNVEMTFGQTILTADTVTMDLKTEIATAEDNVVIIIDERQEIRGSYLEYHTNDQTGYLLDAEGELDLLSLPQSTRRAVLPTDLAASTVFEPPADQRGFKFIRFEAERVDLTPENWLATKIQVTNDTEGPPLGPELERRSETATLQELPDGTSLLTMKGSSLWFDRKFRLPLRDNTIVLGDDDARRRPPFSLFYDEDDGGIIARRNFEVLGQRNVSFTLAPRVRLEQFSNQDGILAAFGLDLDFNLVSPGDQITDIFVALNSLAFASGVEEEIRARIQHRIPVGNNQGDVVLRYAYRPRFRPIFGETDRRTDLFHEAGVAYNSPIVPLGKSGIGFSSRIAGDYLDGESRTNRLESVQVGRLRIDAALGTKIPLWTVDISEKNQPRFSYTPIQQGFWVLAGIRTSYAAYTSNDSQSSLIGSIGLQTVLGEFNRDFFDYTGFLAVYSNGAIDDGTPLRFDRFRASEVVSLGLVQQLYGPFRVGAQTRIRLDSGFEELDTLYSLSYDRRTYGIDIQFSVASATGSLTLRIDDFNFFKFGVDSVQEGILQ